MRRHSGRHRNTCHVMLMLLTIYALHLHSACSTLLQLSSTSDIAYISSVCIAYTCTDMPSQWFRSLEVLPQLLYRSSNCMKAIAWSESVHLMNARTVCIVPHGCHMDTTMAPMETVLAVKNGAAIDLTVLLHQTSSRALGSMTSKTTGGGRLVHLYTVQKR